MVSDLMVEPTDRQERPSADAGKNMLPAFVRPVLHAAHTVMFFLLFVSGVLLVLPELRSVISGGYSLLVRQGHWWGGIAYFAFPAAVALVWGPKRVFSIGDETRNAKVLWQRIHLGVTVAMTAAFTLTGVVLWAKRALPADLVGLSRWTHNRLTWVAGALVVVHLLGVALSAMMARARPGLESRAESSI